MVRGDTNQQNVKTKNKHNKKREPVLEIPFFVKSL